MSEIGILTNNSPPGVKNFHPNFVSCSIYIFVYILWSPFIAHHHLCLDMFQAEALINKHSKNMGLKDVFDGMF